MTDLDPRSKKDRKRFIKLMASGDPMKDFYDEQQVHEALEEAFNYIDELEEKRK